MKYYNVTMAQEFLRRRLQANYGSQMVVPVDPDTVGLHQSATDVLEKATSEVASQAGLPARFVADRLFDYMYRLEPADVLILVVTVPERGIEMFIELPPGTWTTNMP